jgi:hypothetical protein
VKGLEDTNHLKEIAPAKPGAISFKPNLERHQVAWPASFYLQR